MMKSVRDFFVIPPEVRPEFRQAALQRNRLSMLIICIMILGMELFNMGRVLFASSGLETLNNRIYFGFYSSLFVMAALYLPLDWLMRKKPHRAQLALQYAGVLFCLLWHVCINAYDIYCGHNTQTGIYFTAVLGLAVFILMSAGLAIALHVSACALMLLLTWGRLDSGTQINITFTSVVALAISLTNCRHHVLTIMQRMEISRMNQKLQMLAQRDALTGLLNKTAFQHCVETHLGEEDTALLILDLDDFKSVNDRYGHPCGDFVLKETALKVEAALPQALGVGRIGGDEFAAFLPATDGGKLRETAAELIRSVAAITWHGERVSNGCSIGVCSVGPGGTSYEKLYVETDRALYRAKEGGKDRLCITGLEEGG